MYKSTRDCVKDLDKHKHLVVIKEEVDPYLQMAAIHRRVYDHEGPAILFENVKGCEFPAVSNLFGTMDRSRFIFRKTIESVKKLVSLKADPSALLKNPFGYLAMPFVGLNALPKPAIFSKPVLAREIAISDLPQIQSWPDDGGAFVTLPQVYTEDPDNLGIMKSNVGMYRIQLGGNDYIPNKEIGLHYQIHRGIGVHQAKANAKGQAMKVSIFVGGPPSHSLSAVMPLPEGLPEVAFAGAMAGRGFRHTRVDGFTLSTDADFVITGTVHEKETKPEGPFGDHLGYYSLIHDFPLMKVHKVYARKDAIWPFTVVGRPPQEDTSFGALIHEITGAVIPTELPGLHAVNAVDEAGVHPLLLAIGSERYTPYEELKRPQELLTIANHILGFGQMSLAKYLLIVAKEDDPKLDIHHIDDFFTHMLQRIDWRRDLHFQTETSIDTLDYSSKGLNEGSKVVMAAAGPTIRSLAKQVPGDFSLAAPFNQAQLVHPGILAIQGQNFQSYEKAEKELQTLTDFLEDQHLESLKSIPLIVLVDDSAFLAERFANFLWVTFTRSNPSHDIYGVAAGTRYKHWGCKSSLIIDARIKPFHAPPLIEDPGVEASVDALGAKGGPLHGII